MRNFLIAGALACLAQPAFATEWVLGSSTSNVDYYLDVTSLREVGNWRAIWEKHDLSRDSRVKDREARILQYYDCGGQRSAVKQYAFYDASGNITASHVVPDYQLDWQGAIPETAGETLLRKVCGL